MSNYANILPVSESAKKILHRQKMLAAKMNTSYFSSSLRKDLAKTVSTNRTVVSPIRMESHDGNRAKPLITKPKEETEMTPVSNTAHIMKNSEESVQTRTKDSSLVSAAYNDAWLVDACMQDPMYVKCDPDGRSFHQDVKSTCLFHGFQKEPAPQHTSTGWVYSLEAQSEMQLQKSRKAHAEKYIREVYKSQACPDRRSATSVEQLNCRFPPAARLFKHYQVTQPSETVTCKQEDEYDSCPQSVALPRKQGPEKIESTEDPDVCITGFSGPCITGDSKDVLTFKTDRLSNSRETVFSSNNPGVYTHSKKAVSDREAKAVCTAKPRAKSLVKPIPVPAVSVLTIMAAQANQMPVSSDGSKANSSVRTPTLTNFLTTSDEQPSLVHSRSYFSSLSSQSDLLSNTQRMSSNTSTSYRPPNELHMTNACKLTPETVKKTVAVADPRTSNMSRFVHSDGISCTWPSVYGESFRTNINSTLNPSEQNRDDFRDMYPSPIRQSFTKHTKIPDISNKGIKNSRMQPNDLDDTGRYNFSHEKAVNTNISECIEQSQFKRTKHHVKRIESPPVDVVIVDSSTDSDENHFENVDRATFHSDSGYVSDLNTSMHDRQSSLGIFVQSNKDICLQNGLGTLASKTNNKQSQQRDRRARKQRNSSGSCSGSTLSEKTGTKEHLQSDTYWCPQRQSTEKSSGPYYAEGGQRNYKPSSCPANQAHTRDQLVQFTAEAHMRPACTRYSLKNYHSISDYVNRNEPDKFSCSAFRSPNQQLSTCEFSAQDRNIGQGGSKEMEKNDIKPATAKQHRKKLMKVMNKDDDRENGKRADHRIQKDIETSCVEDNDGIIHKITRNFEEKDVEPVIVEDEDSTEESTKDENSGFWNNSSKERNGNTSECVKESNVKCVTTYTQENDSMGHDDFRRHNSKQTAKDLNVVKTGQGKKKHSESLRGIKSDHLKKSISKKQMAISDNSSKNKTSNNRYDPAKGKNSTSQIRGEEKGLKRKAHNDRVHSKQQGTKNQEGSENDHPKTQGLKSLSETSHTPEHTEIPDGKHARKKVGTHKKKIHENYKRTDVKRENLHTMKVSDTNAKHRCGQGPSETNSSVESRDRKQHQKNADGRHSSEHGKRHPNRHSDGNYDKMVTRCLQDSEKHISEQFTKTSNLTNVHRQREETQSKHDAFPTRESSRDKFSDHNDRHDGDNVSDSNIFCDIETESGKEIVVQENVSSLSSTVPSSLKSHHQRPANRKNSSAETKTTTEQLQESSKFHRKSTRKRRKCVTMENSGTPEDRFAGVEIASYGTFPQCVTKSPRHVVEGPASDSVLPNSTHTVTAQVPNVETDTLPEKKINSPTDSMNIAERIPVHSGGTSIPERLMTRDMFLSNSINPASGLQRFECNLCDATFVKYPNLLFHLQHHDRPRFKCDICNKTYGRRETLKAHRMLHTGESAVDCPICGRTLKTMACLVIHMRIHTDEKPYSCPLCPKSFRQQSALTSHSRVHTKERPYQCHVCLKTYRFLKNLENHRYTHTGERPYVCPICNADYYQVGALNIHLKVHKGERPFQCVLCKMRFGQRSHLIRHRRQVHFENLPFTKQTIARRAARKPKAYQCNKCGQGFTTAYSRRRHMKTFCPAVCGYSVAL